jgi:hypothetical protein
MIVKFDKTQKSLAFFGLAALSAMRGIIEYTHPTVARPTGRWSFVVGAIFDLAGSFGLIILWLLICASFAVAGFLIRRKK